jgi:hypothetical protein
MHWSAVGYPRVWVTDYLLREMGDIWKCCGGYLLVGARGRYLVVCVGISVVKYGPDIWVGRVVHVSG